MMSGRRVLSVMGGAAFGLAVLVSAHPAAVAEAAAGGAAVSTRVFSVPNLDKTACMERAERAMSKNMLTVWDFASAANSTVHGRRATATALVYCDAESQGVRVLVNVHADSVDEATALRNSIEGYITI